jgi:hypothetical protein
MALKLKRGLEADRLLYTPQVGELVYTTDNKQIFVGDGTTAGGNPASGGGVVAGLSVPATDPFYAEAQAAPNDPFLDGDLHLRGNNIIGTGDINIDGTITATGNINLGDGSGDTVNFAGGVGTDILPSANLTYSLGTSGSAWDEVVAGAVLTGSVTVETGNITMVDSGAGAGSLIGNVVGADTTLLVDSVNSLIPGDAIEGTVTANLNGNVTGNVTGNLTGIVTLDTMYGLDGTTVIIDGDIANSPDNAAIFTGEFNGLLVGDSEGSHAGPVTNLAADSTALDPDGGTGNVGILTVGEAEVPLITTTTVQGGGTALTISEATGVTVQASAGDLTLQGQGLTLTDDGTGTAISDTNGITVTGAVDLSGASLTATAVTFGAVTTGNLTVGGNLTATGNIAATTAETLLNTRTINGVGFNGSANITIEDNTKLPTSGAIPMLGALTLSGDPTLALHATTKQYVDGKFFDPTVNTTVSAAQTTFTGAILGSDFQEETSGAGLAISSVNGNININAGTGTVGIQSIAGGTVSVSGLDIVGTSIAASDSSSITVDNATTFLSDVAVDGRLTVGEIDALQIQTAGAGVPRLESDTNLEISVPNGQVNIVDGLFSPGQYTLAGLGTDFTAVEGDIAFVEDSSLPQPHVYTGGAWMPMMSPTLGWTLGANGTADFTFTGPGFTGTVNDPNFTVYRGHTYVFDNSANGATHPFNLQTSDPGVAGYAVGDLYTTGTSGDNEGVYIWTVPMDAPTTLYYVCTNHGGAMFGTITVA